MKKNSLINYSDGAKVRLHNKRISFKEIDNKVMIIFDFADTDADKPACQHKCHKGRVRETFIQMSTEAMSALAFAYINYRRSKATNINNE